MSYTRYRRASHVGLNDDIPEPAQIPTVWSEKRKRRSTMTFDIGDLTTQGRRIEVVSFFRTKPCTLRNCNFGDACHFYHSLETRRRAPALYEYKPVLCRNLGNCHMGDDCGYAHSTAEVLYHPDMYKTQRCTGGSTCVNRNCPMYHGQGLPRDPIKSPIVPILGNQRDSLLQKHKDKAPADVRRIRSDLRRTISTLRMMNVSFPPADTMETSDLVNASPPFNEKVRRRSQTLGLNTGEATELIANLDRLNSLSTFSKKKKQKFNAHIAEIDSLLETAASQKCAKDPFYKETYARAMARLNSIETKLIETERGISETPYHGPLLVEVPEVPELLELWREKFEGRL